MVCLTCFFLWRNPDLRNLPFRVLWLTGIVAITITGIVYHWLLSGLRELYGLALFGDLLAHSAVPIMAVLGFFVFGPRGLATKQVAWLTLVYFVAWGIFTVTRGQMVDWYPYPFIDVNDKGWARVIVNGTGIAIFYVAVAFGFLVIDRLLTSEERDRAVNS
jgi:hypothetical protein